MKRSLVQSGRFSSDTFFRRQRTEFFFSKTNRQMKTGKHNKYDITSVLSCKFEYNLGLSFFAQIYKPQMLA